MNTNNLIEIDPTKIVELIQFAYVRSRPQGMGLFHFMNEPMSKEQASEIISIWHPKDIYMDYIRGRAVKLTIMRTENNQYWINPFWFDHTIREFYELVEKFALDPKEGLAKIDKKYPGYIR